MSKLEFLCGSPIHRRPERFTCDRALTDDTATYHLDLEQVIVRRIKPSDSVQPIAYFKLILASDDPIPIPQAAAVATTLPWYDLALISVPGPLDPAYSNDWVNFPPPPPPRYERTARRRLNLRGFKAVLGTVVVVTGFLLLYPLYPGVKYHAQEFVAQTFSNNAALAEAPPALSVDSEVIIPKIGVRTRILDASSLKILDKQEGVWHQLGNINHNLVLAGHRFKYLPPNTSTLYNLSQLVVGDSIIVDYDGRRTIYAVSGISTVAASRVDVLNQDGGPRLTIYTCSDKRETHRIVVHANIVP